MCRMLQFLLVVAAIEATVPPGYSTPLSTTDLPLLTSTIVPSASPSPPQQTFQTINTCEEHSVQHQKFVERSKIPLACRCPPGFVVVHTHPQTNRTLCVGVRVAQPWQDGCVQSGTATDLFDLDPTELSEVRTILLDMRVSECWISARRLLKYGELVRRLPGSQWNAPVEQSTLYHVPLSGATYTKDHDCAMLRIDRNATQLSYQNCSIALPQLCLYREANLLQLHCDADEFTTRYSSYQRYCFSIRKSNVSTVEMLKMQTQLRLVTNVNGIFSIDSNRKGQLLVEMNDASKECSDSSDVIYADQIESTHHAHKRDLENDVPSISNKDLISSNPGNIPCVAQQRLQIVGDSLVTADGGTSPSMYLYFDKARHKLFLTVYGDRWFWRENASSAGFVCFTNTNDEQLHRLKVRKLRASRVKWTVPARDGWSDANRTMYEIKMKEYGPPRMYWCEAHLVPDFALIKSVAVMAQRKANCRRYFSAIIELQLDWSSIHSPETLRPKDYDRRVKEYIETRRKRLPELKHIFEVIKKIDVQRVEDFWRSANSEWYTVRLLLHIVTKCRKKWDKLELLLEHDESNEIGKTSFIGSFVTGLCGTC
uniref:Uncharacterized protein n=1 Tax=Anopheles maculatus TaxID=74869 RepID=A0A182T248_9DIPT